MRNKWWGILYFLLGLLLFTLLGSNQYRQAKLKLAEKQLALMEHLNHHLGAQLEKVNQEVRVYLKQSQALQQSIQTEIQHKRVKTDEILQILEKHKSWADQPVPDDVARLLKQTDVSNTQRHTADLPDGQRLPTDAVNP